MVLVPCGSSAEGYQGEIVLQKGEYHDVEIDMDVGDLLEISYEVQEGKSINLLLMNGTHFKIFETALELNLATDIYYFKGGSLLNRTNGTIRFRSLTQQTYHVIFDNTGMLSKGAKTNDSVRLSFEMEHEVNLWTISAIGKTAAVGVVIVIILIAFDHLFWKYNTRRHGELSPVHAGTSKVRTVVKRRIILKKKK